MRVKTIKLLIFATSSLAALAMAGRVYWFWKEKETLIRPEPPYWQEYEARVRAGKAEITKDKAGRPLDPATLHPKSRPVHWWWWEHRNKLLSENATVEVAKVPEANYAFFGDLNLSGMARPAPPKEVERPRVETGPRPYDQFKNIKVVYAYELLDNGKITPWVWIYHKVDPPRAALADEGKVEEWYYTEGDKIRPMPEVKVETIDVEKGEVTFRFPKHLSTKNYEDYQGTEEDSQTSTVAYRGIAAYGEGLVPTRAANGDGEEERSPVEEARYINPATNQPFPTKTTEVPGTDVWDVGTEDYAELQGMDYEEALRRDVTVTSYARGGVNGVQINKVRSGSLFAGKGLLRGDVITNIGGQKITTLGEAVRYFRDHPNDRVYHVTVHRNGRDKEVSYRVPRR